MKTFTQYLQETHGRGTKGDKQLSHKDYASWESDARKLGYHVTHHESSYKGNKSHYKWSDAHKVERDDPKQEYENHPHGPPLNRSRGTFWHAGAGYPHGFLRYKYMPTNEAILNTAQDKAQRQVFKGFEKKIIKPTLPKSTDLQKKMIKPMQSNVQNMINAIASHPTGVPSGIPNGAVS